MLHQTGVFRGHAIYRCHLNLHQLDPCCHGNENLEIGVASYGSLGLAYVDLRAAFDSVDCNVLWLLLRSLGIPRTAQAGRHVQGPFTDTVSCVRLEGEVSDWFHFSCGCLLYTSPSPRD